MGGVGAEPEADVPLQVTPGSSALLPTTWLELTVLEETVLDSPSWTNPESCHSLESSTQMPGPVLGAGVMVASTARSLTSGSSQPGQGNKIQ